MPKISCAAEPIMPFVYVIFSFVLLYIIFFTFIRSTGLLQPDECLEILQSIDQALAEATEPDYDPLGQEEAQQEDLEATKKLEETTEPQSQSQFEEEEELNKDSEGESEPRVDAVQSRIGAAVITRRKVTSTYS